MTSSRRCLVVRLDEVSLDVVWSRIAEAIGALQKRENDAFVPARSGFLSH
jgi:hypothetical protein